MRCGSPESTRTLGWRTLLLRAGILVVGWWSLNEGELAGAVVGTFVVLLALAASGVLTTASSPRWRPLGVLLFAFHFVSGSIRGGMDVARRAFARALPLAPAMITYELQLRARTGRHLFMGALSLMPGTLVVNVDEDRLELHVLAEDPSMLRLQHRLEAAIARAVGEPAQGSHA